MKVSLLRFSIILGLVICLIGTAGCSKMFNKSSDDKKDNEIRLGLLSPNLEEFERTNIDAFKSNENKVEIKSVGVEKYDAFFKDAAIINGTLTELRFIIEKYNSKELLNSDIEPIIIFAEKSIPNMIDKIKSLIKTGSSLNPSNDFTGMKKSKVPGVTKGLASTVKNLKDASSEISKIYKEISNLK